MSADKVVSIDGTGPVVPEDDPVPSVVSLLKDLLVEAEAGAIRSIAVAVVGRGAAFKINSATNAGHLALLGVVNRLQYDLCQSFD